MRAKKLFLLFLMFLFSGCEPAPTPPANTATFLPAASATMAPVPMATSTAVPMMSTSAATFAPRQTPAQAVVNVSTPSWSRDGDWLAYTNSKGEVWLTGIDGSSDHASLPISALTSLGETHWSPKADAFLVVWSGKLRFYSVIRGKLNGEPLAMLPEDRGIISGANWSPDGKQIAYTYAAELAADGSGFPGEGWVYDLQSGQTRQVTDTSKLTYKGISGVRLGLAGTPIWSPDGEKLLFQTDLINYMIQDGDYPLVVNLKTGQQIALTNAHFGLGWSADNQSIFTMKGSLAPNETLDIYAVDLAHGRWTNLTLSRPGCDPYLDPVVGNPACQNTLVNVNRQIVAGPDGKYLFSFKNNVDFSNPDAAGWGFRLMDAARVVAAEYRQDTTHWFLAPGFLAKGKVGYLVIDPQPITGAWSFHTLRKVMIVGSDTALLEPNLIIRAENPGDVRWSPRGDAVAVIALDAACSKGDCRISTHIEILKVTVAME